MRLEGVGKRYRRGGPWVLRGVDLELELEPGALVRVEGANGSGKSTLLRLIAGLEAPSRGRIGGRGRAAYVPERFPPALPFDAEGYLRHLGMIQGLSRAEAVRRAGLWLERFGIGDRSGTPMHQLSKGTCQKVAVAQALLAEPDLLLLDEAWTGLDQAARALLDSAAAERAEAGGTVVFVDHDPGRLAGVVSCGYRVRAGAVEESGEQAAAVVGGPMAVVEVELAADARLPERLPGAPVRSPVPGGVRLEVAAGYGDALLRRLLALQPPVHIRSVRPPGVPE
ncbi:ATP-binding cassette domain-containing protein [Streptomyces sp. NPDC092296]|uniref:ABC transporter ATP-binding protein n=1 Tax=Streptomyces sp. NPDC092296 TaxID=3366012 RepID=UPI0037FF867F